MVLIIPARQPGAMKSLQISDIASDKVRRVQESLTIARKGKGLFGLKG
jgi:hypothetical protein